LNDQYLKTNTHDFHKESYVYNQFLILTIYICLYGQNFECSHSWNVSLSYVLDQPFIYVCVGLYLDCNDSVKLLYSFMSSNHTLLAYYVYRLL